MSEEDPIQTAFKICTKCGHVWPTRDGFLTDPLVELQGYQAWLPDLVLGLFLFNHLSCGTTVALKAAEFQDLYDGPVYRTQNTGSETCLGYCKDRDELRMCPQECECAWVREVVQIVKGWPKASANA